MPIIRLGEWIPDAADLRSPGAPSVINALPGLNSYRPMLGLSATTEALGNRPRGAIEAVDNSGTVYQYAGDVDTLYQLSGTAWADVSKGGGYSSGDSDIWEFVRWKEKILATNFADNPQSITMGGSNFADLTSALRMHTLAVVRDFVVAGNTYDGTDGAVTDRVRWCAFDDETDWTVSPTTLADYRDLKVGGAIQRILGGQYGLIVSKKSIHRMTWSGAPAVFQIDEVIPGIGAISPGCVTRLGERAFLISENGFIMVLAGTTHEPIGAGRVNDFIRRDLDENNAHRISSVADPRSSRVYWAYPGAGNTDGRPNKIIVYDVALNKWGLIEENVELLWRSGGVGVTLDALDDYMLGAELVSNGDFGSGSGWTAGTGWSIGSGVATKSAGTASDLEQSLSLVEGEWYRVEFDVSRSAGEVTPSLGGTDGTAIDASDTDIKESIQAGAGGNLAFEADSAFAGTVDNVSVKLITDIDDLEISLDSSQWKGGAPLFSAFNADYKNGNFAGDKMTAVIELREDQFFEGRFATVRNFEPLVDGGTVTARMGTRNSQSDGVSWTSSLSLKSSGRFGYKKKARYHRFELTVSGDWNDIIGVSVPKESVSAGGLRG